MACLDGGSRKLLRRYENDGEAAFEPKSKRPHHSPNATPIAIEEVVLLRKQLGDLGVDSGPKTIHYHLTQRMEIVPSRSTIANILKRRGFVTPQPQKRPKSSYIRFEASLPNECWQSDITHWTLADGTEIEVLNFFDDHSRLALSSVAYPTVNALCVVEQFRNTAAVFGLPASMLTDNGMVFTARFKSGRVAFEYELERLGIIEKHSRPNHPTTCGKIERWHQTLKRHLRKKPAAQTITQLQTQLDEFLHYYNNERPHTSLNDE